MSLGTQVSCVFFGNLGWIQIVKSLKTHSVLKLRGADFKH